MLQRFKKRPVLYKAFAEKKRDAQAFLASEEKKTKQVNGVKKVRYRGRAEVCVVSLFHGSGSTYLAKIIAVFLAKYRNFGFNMTR